MPVKARHPPEPRLHGLISTVGSRRAGLVPPVLGPEVLSEYDS